MEKCRKNPFMKNENNVDRRDFLKVSGAASATGIGFSTCLANTTRAAQIPNAAVSDSLCHGPGWETFNPGFWQIKDGNLRRRIKNYGDRARSTGFPFHYETHGREGGVMSVDYDPSLPPGVLYRNDWKLTGSWSVSARFTYHGEADVKREGDDEAWKMYSPGYSMIGIAFGAKNLFESYNRVRNTSFVGWTSDGKFGFSGKIIKASKQKPKSIAIPNLTPGDEVQIRLTATEKDGVTQLVATLMDSDNKSYTVTHNVGAQIANGYLGVVGRGLADFSVTDFEVEPGGNQKLDVGEIDCYTCYPLGDTLTQQGDQWKVRFVALFANDGKQAEVRVSDSPNPAGGWKDVSVAGTAEIVNHQWRRNTATIHVTLPENPANKTLYYTVWKDGRRRNFRPPYRDSDWRQGRAQDIVGDVAVVQDDYVGRLPQLESALQNLRVELSRDHEWTASSELTDGLEDPRRRRRLAVSRSAHCRQHTSTIEDYNFQIHVLGG